MKKVMKSALYTFALLLLGFSTAILAYLHFFASGEALSGEWTADLDMTKQAAVAALDWLQDIEGVSVSPEDMEAKMKGLTVQVRLTMEQKSRSAGVFGCSIMADSYETCRQEAYEALACSFRELLGERLRMAGYEGGTDQEAVEALVAGSFGMSTVSYLMACGPKLLPSLEELQARYEGGGDYESAEGILTRRFEEGGIVFTRKERYLLQDATLILLEEDAENGDRLRDGYPVVYTSVSDRP